jgi:putative polyhydroxyalkanoate system protein
VSKISIRRSHSLSPQKALSIAKSIAADIERDYGVRSSWKDDTLLFKGSGVNGTLRLAPKEMVLEVQLGIMLFALRDSIARQIENKFDQMLSSKSATPHTSRSRPTSNDRRKNDRRNPQAARATAHVRRIRITTSPEAPLGSR